MTYAGARVSEFAARAPLRAGEPQRAAGGGAKTLAVSLGHSSLAGPRPGNEDFAGAVTPEGDEREAKGILVAVADGVGGHAKGREAAEYSVRSLAADYYATPETWGVARGLDVVLDATNRWLISQSQRSREAAGMASTLTAVVLRGNRYYLAHVGDSRAYLWRGGRLTQLSEDHTWEHPELSNVLRRAMGLDMSLVVDHTDGELLAGDRFVLATDGVWGTLHDEGIALCLGREPAAEAAANALALEAVRAGSHDNCTALVINVESVPAGALTDSLELARRLPLPSRLRPGQEIDGLRVVELIHESRVTLLYTVRQLESEQTLVMKTLRPEAGDDEAVAALVHEEWLARRVPAPLFPQLVSHVGRQHLYYLMSWHAGETLKARIARGQRSSPYEVSQLGTKILRGVAALHRLAIVHRDIKPDNLHLDRSGQLRILDLGVAASDSAEFREINNPGTPSYMAPELFAGARANEVSDLYACGVTLYELLTGKYPYGEIEPFQTPRFGVPTAPTRYRPDTPEWLESIVLKACARAPKDRFETAEEFMLALERGAGRPLATTRRVPLAQRNPTLALKVVAVISLILNLLLIVLLMKP